MTLIDVLGRDKLIEQRRDMPLVDLSELNDRDLADELAKAETFIHDRYKIHADDPEHICTERLTELRRMESAVRLIKQRLIMWHGMGV